MNPKIKCIRSSEIENSLAGNTRQYLVGMLKNSQVLKHIEDEKLEIGITKYEKAYSEKPHVHSQAYEYMYMLSGYTKYLNLDTNEEVEFRRGDFYIIEPGIKYAQKSKPGTELIFIKAPPGNDKTEIEIREDVKTWLDDGIKTIRTDYSYDNKAPKANSIKPAAAVAIVKDSKILMLKRSDSGNWTMPGGTMEIGETLVDCALREVKEETGLDIEILDLIGTYTDPNIVIEYSDGEVRQEFGLLYYGSVIGGNVSIDNESTDYKWIDLSEVLDLQLAPSQRARLENVINYIQTGKRVLK